jgi:hypothetical protein
MNAGGMFFWIAAALALSVSAMTPRTSLADDEVRIFVKIEAPARPFSFCVSPFSLIKPNHVKHLGLWEMKARPPPRATGPPKTPEYLIDYSSPQLPTSDKWLYVDPEYPEAFPA